MLTKPATFIKRHRRNRQNSAIRALIEETALRPQHLVAPLFALPGHQTASQVRSLPGVFRLSCDLLVKECSSLLQVGVQSVVLFPVIPETDKDARGSFALTPNVLHQAIRAIKEAHPNLLVMADLALDPYTDHGHDGLIDKNYQVLNDPTVEILQEMAILAAEAGADVVAPSDMMDGRVQAIRKALDAHHFSHVNILSYAVKFASSFYGPFRDALQSSPKKGDKKGYQVNPANRREALLETQSDEEEGADLLLIKPALPYLDIVTKVREKTLLPLGAYQVSGEYAALKVAAQQGVLDFEKALLETLISMRRAGADFIFTYGAKEAATLLANK